MKKFNKEDIEIACCTFRRHSLLDPPELDTVRVEMKIPRELWLKIEKQIKKRIE